MTSKQRALLKAQANPLNPLFQIGKEGLTEAVCAQTLEAFNTRELLKVRVLRETAPEEPKEIALSLSQKTGSEVVQVIGNVIILYKQKQEEKAEGKKVSPKKGKPLSRVKAIRAKDLEKKKV